MFGEVGFPALEIGFNGRVFKNVIHHEARIGFEAEELHGFVERHEEPVEPLAFEELMGISKGFQRGIPGGGKHITFIGKEAPPNRISSPGRCAYGRLRRKVPVRQRHRLHT